MGQYITDSIDVEREDITNDVNDCANRDYRSPSTDGPDIDDQEGGTCTVMMDVLDMFIDVSALVREKSGFTQYTNHCYTVDKDTERLIIELVS